MATLNCSQAVYVCSYSACKKTFPSMEHLKNHLALCHNDEIAIEKSDEVDSAVLQMCKVDGCTARFVSKKQLYDHKYNVHKLGRVYTCIVCDMKFVTPSKLAKHAKTHDGYRCEVEKCTFIGQSVIERRQHVAQCHKELSARKSKYCHRCSKQFHKPSALQRHLLLHKKIVKCPDIGCTFECFRPKLAAHIKKQHRNKIPVHSDSILSDKPYECHFCKKSFKVAEYLRKHIFRVHTKTYAVYDRKTVLVCPLADCQKTFPNEAKLESHVNTHLNVKPYKCVSEGCNSAFAGKMALQKHMRLFHLTNLKDISFLVKKTNKESDFVFAQHELESLPVNCNDSVIA